MFEYYVEWFIRAIVAGFVSQIPIMNVVALLGMAGICLWAYVTDPTLLQYLFLQPHFDIDENFLTGLGIAIVIGLIIGGWAGDTLKKDFNRIFKKFITKLKMIRL